MSDCEHIFQTTLHKKLKERINASIFVGVEDYSDVTLDEYDELIIRIKKDEFIYTEKIEYFTNQVLFGLSTDEVANMVVKNYRKFLIDKIEKKYFYHK